MRIELGAEKPEWEKLLPPEKDDGSGVGINYADAYLKIFKTTLEDGRKIAAKRRGLKITLSVGEKTGEALLRRLEHGPEEKKIVLAAIEEAARDAGARFEVVDATIQLELG